MQHKAIGLIGAGNMASAIISRLLAAGYPAQKIYACDPNIEKQKELQNLGMQATTVPSWLAEVEVVIFAVKPQSLADVWQQLPVKNWQTHQWAISVVAGVPIKVFANHLSAQLAMVRCMPNTPALIGYGATGLYANTNVGSLQKEWTEQLFGTLGKILWCDHEADIDAITALSGSGPAYFFLMIEAMQQAAKQMGLAPETVLPMIAQTALGAAQMVLASSESPTELRTRVTSKGGTTAAALACLEQQQFTVIVQQAILAAWQRAQELAQ